MKIKKIAIQNFRSIKELRDFELKNLSLLVGENGTSKTSILEAIHFCLSTKNVKCKTDLISKLKAKFSIYKLFDI